MSKYPEHDKMKMVKDLADAAGDFIEWLREHGYKFAKWDAEDGLVPQYRPTEAWLADWLGIDLGKLEDEKRQMLDELRKEPKRTYEIWVEGYRATGESGKAFRLGSMSGSTFKEACTRWFEQFSDDKNLFDPERLTYWGCHMFDNEADARKLFG